MAKRKALGLDELMIVNPGRSGSGSVFLGEDGILYQVHGHNVESPAGIGRFLRRRPRKTMELERRRFFLGEDGTLYEVVK
jgi:hypothetical protein